MSKRPEHVRCENCCYWTQYLHPKGKRQSGKCERYPPPVVRNDDGAGGWTVPPPSTVKDERCGEFREEWPEEDSKPFDFPKPPFVRIGETAEQAWKRKYGPEWKDRYEELMGREWRDK